MKTLKTFPTKEMMSKIATNRLLSILSLSRKEIKLFEKQILEFGFDEEKHKRLPELQRIFNDSKEILKEREHISE